MNSIKCILSIILWSMLFFSRSCSTSDGLKTGLLINCGLALSSEPTYSSDNREWQSDEDPAFVPDNIDAISTAVTSDTTADPPFKVARVFRSPFTYSFSTPQGPIFIRLYFSNIISYNNIPPYKFSTSVLANNFTLLQDFNAYINSPNDPLKYEFQVIVPSGKNNLKLTFSPGENINHTDTSSPTGYVNGIEIRSIPDGLYIQESNQYIYVTNRDQGYTIDNDSSAFQTLFRLNVGGQYVDARDDSPGDGGGMMRTWEADEGYVVGNFRGTKSGLDREDTVDLVVNYTKKTPAYVAPMIVYVTTRKMGDNLPKVNFAWNLTWQFEVDSGFTYLVRLHFRENDQSVNASFHKVMIVYIGGQVAEWDLDVWFQSGGTGVPMYKDYAISIPGNDGVGSSGSKVPLSLALHPSLASKDVDVFLNGLEILKLSTNRNLAVPNPPYNGTTTTEQNQASTKKSSTHKMVIVIGVVIGGLLLLCVVLLALFRRRVQYKKLFTSAKSSSTGQWLPASVESQSSSANTKANSSRPSLPSDLCRRFSLVEMKVATNDFDENSIVGTGGFGKVYKGCIDNGATNVAIKRLNPLSKQGEREFLTEIEMLSRLRHVHLVSLIGYCEEHREMILVYEYMPRGTLRDHLNYKGAKGKENNEVLSWKQRLMICLGSARGLDYLHAGAKELIIHRDVKSTNILLDDKWTAKVSDFGLSKVGPASETGIGHVSTAVKGSVGYLDPEYYRRQQLTEKSDVYSFGVVLFEVLCARPAANPNLPKEQVNLANWARSCYKKGTLHTIIDPSLTGQIAPESLRKFGEIAEMCVKNIGDERPSMRDVLWSLEFALQLQETAEKNTIDGSPMVDLPIRDGVGYDGSIDNDVFTNSSRENISLSTGVGIDTQSNSGSTSTITNMGHGMGMKSGSVFSEIMDPRAR